MLNVLLFFGTYLGSIIAAFRIAPVFAFVLYQAVYFFYPRNKWWGYMVPDLSYSFFTVVLMMLVFALNFKQLNKNSLLKAPQIKYFFGMFCMMHIVANYAAIPIWHNLSVVDYTKLFVIICLAYKLVDTKKHLQYILQGYIFGAWYISFMVFQLGRNAGDRVEGAGLVDAPDSNGLAAAIAPSVVLAFYYFWISKAMWQKALFAIALVFTANAVVLINSRASFLAVAGSMAFFMWHMYFSSIQRKNQKKAAVGLTILGLCGSLYIVDASFVERVKSIWSEKKAVTGQQVEVRAESGATRTEFWKAAIEVSYDYPLGLGVRGFDHVSPYYLPEDLDTGRTRNRSVHSTWFEALTELGYPGMFMFLGMLFSSLWCLKKAKQIAREENDPDSYFKLIAIQCACIAFAIAMTFMNRMRAEILYWLVLFCACAYNVYVIKRTALDPQPNAKKKRPGFR